MPLGVDPAVEVLEEGEVGGEQVLDDARVDVVDGADPADHAGDQDHRQIGGVLPYAVVPEGDQLVAGGGQSHHAAAVYGAGVVHVPARQLEGELGP